MLTYHVASPIVVSDELLFPVISSDPNARHCSMIVDVFQTRLDAERFCAHHNHPDSVCMDRPSPRPSRAPEPDSVVLDAADHAIATHPDFQVHR